MTEQTDAAEVEALDFRNLGSSVHRFRCTDPDCRHYEDPLYFTPRDNDAASAVLASDWLAAREAAAEARGAERALREAAEAIHPEWAASEWWSDWLRARSAAAGGA